MFHLLNQTHTYNTRAAIKYQLDTNTYHVHKQHIIEHIFSEKESSEAWNEFQIISTIGLLNCNFQNLDREYYKFNTKSIIHKH